MFCKSLFYFFRMSCRSREYVFYHFFVSPIKIRTFHYIFWFHVIYMDVVAWCLNGLMTHNRFWWFTLFIFERYPVFLYIENQKGGYILHFFGVFSNKKNFLIWRELYRVIYAFIVRDRTDLTTAAPVLWYYLMRTKHNWRGNV